MSTRKSAPNCTKCSNPKPMHEWQVKKDNVNKGRWFYVCGACGCFKWADEKPSSSAHSPSGTQPTAHMSRTPARRLTTPVVDSYSRDTNHRFIQFEPDLGADDPANWTDTMQLTETPQPERALPSSLNPTTPPAPAGRTLPASLTTPSKHDPPTRTMPASLITPVKQEPARRTLPASLTTPPPQDPWRSMHSPSGSMPASNAAAQGTSAAQAPPLDGPDGKGAVVMFSALNSAEFGVSTLTFDEAFLAAIKLLERPLRSWDGGKKVWVCPLEARDEVVEHLTRHNFRVQNVPKSVENIITGHGYGSFQRQSPEAVDRRLQSLGPELLDRLYPFQRDGVRLGLSLGGRLLLADEMGLGKTGQALALMSCYPEDWPLLIICPKTMRGAWADALNRWVPEHLRPAEDRIWQIMTGKDLQKLGKEAPSALDDRRQIVIITYTLVKTMFKDMREHARRYRAIICDEAHSLKTYNTQQTKVVGQMVREAKRAVLVTGTPIQSRPIELYSQMDMLRPNLLGSYWQFGERYCKSPDQPPAMYPGQEFWGSNNLAELNAVLSATLMVRRTKAEVLDDLPEKRRHCVKIATDPEHARNLSEAVLKMKELEAEADLLQGSRDENAQRRAMMKRQQALMAYFRATGPAKVKGAVAFVATQLAGGENVLCFAHHHNVLDELQEELGGRHRVGFVRIDGSTTDKKRNAAVATFQNDPQCRLALLSVTAAGQGITLTAACKVVFAELYWNPSTLMQAEDRAHRIGQHRPVDVYFLTAPGSSDDIVWPLINRKVTVVGRALNGDGDTTALRATPQAFDPSNWEKDLQQYIQEHQSEFAEATAKFHDELEDLPIDGGKRKRQQGTGKGKAGAGRRKAIIDDDEDTAGSDDDGEPSQGGKRKQRPRAAGGKGNGARARRRAIIEDEDSAENTAADDEDGEESEDGRSVRKKLKF